MSYNEKIYAHLLNVFEVTNKHDRKLLANKLSKAWKERDCCDNFRICHSDDDRTQTINYKGIQNEGCCGFYDLYVKNPLTNNSYWIGFNHGH